MKEVTVTCQVFDFDELSLKAQQHAHNIFCADPLLSEISTEDSIEIFAQKLENTGIIIDPPLFNDKGTRLKGRVDVDAFTSNSSNRLFAAFAVLHKFKAEKEGGEYILFDSREYGTVVDVTDNLKDYLDSTEGWREINNAIEKDIKYLCKKLAQDISDDLHYVHSLEYFKLEITETDKTFLKNGDVFYH